MYFVGLNGLGVVVLEIFKVLFKQFGLVWSCVFLGIVLIVSLILLIFTEEKLERQDAENNPDPLDKSYQWLSNGHQCFRIRAIISSNLRKTTFRPFLLYSVKTVRFVKSLLFISPRNKVWVQPLLQFESLKFKFKYPLNRSWSLESRTVPWRTPWFEGKQMADSTNNILWIYVKLLINGYIIL